MKAHEFDNAFEEGADISAHLDLDRASRPNREIRRVNVDFPAWMVEELDREAQRLGITRQAIIKVWIARQLDEHRACG
ncbi:type II toxin-antitoxin system BrnA family antitoxin [Desulfovibrio psychrotolerans]|uniref:CopG family transcriptional regulator n=1 Tax=Desulfovibrio psychrotolerans TaxID=415242 RepID=A0A7J0BT79_9BACT|nr:CopG family transcriptional regulator [Desulfovibrio psychrotolerans]GFM36923.1 hypothetical protein DSM19430T_16070 [Desulfovibrio psychrotolerans]